MPSNLTPLICSDLDLLVLNYLKFVRKVSQKFFSEKVSTVRKYFKVMFLNCRFFLRHLVLKGDARTCATFNNVMHKNVVITEYIKCYILCPITLKEILELFLR